MGTRRPNPKLAKIHRTYTVEEVARLYDVHRNTVRQWIKGGLPSMDNARPTLVRGQDLADYLRKKRLAKKRPCLPGQIYCMRCREPRQPAGQQAVYEAHTLGQGNLIGQCPTCGSRMFRRVSFARLVQISGPLQVFQPNAQQHIAETAPPSVNSDFKQDASANENAQPQQRADQAPVLRFLEGGQAAE